MIIVDIFIWLARNAEILLLLDWSLRDMSLFAKVLLRESVFHSFDFFMEGALKMKEYYGKAI